MILTQRDPQAFWTWLRDHHDRKASDGLTDAPEVHAELAWNAQRHLTAIELHTSRTNNQRER